MKTILLIRMAAFAAMGIAIMVSTLFIYYSLLPWLTRLLNSDASLDAMAAQGITPGEAMLGYYLIGPLAGVLFIRYFAPKPRIYPMMIFWGLSLLAVVLSLMTQHSRGLTVARMVVPSLEWRFLLLAVIFISMSLIGAGKGKADELTKEAAELGSTASDFMSGMF